MKHKLLLLYSWFVRSILFFLPDAPSTMRFRGWLYGLGMKRCGKDFQVTHDAILKGLELISVGNHVFIGDMTILIGSGYISIEDNVLIGPHCTIVSSNHIFKNGAFSLSERNPGDIIIAKGAWVAANCVIGKGGQLPPGSVLGACSFLSRALKEKNCIYAGSPARLIKHLIEEDHTETVR